MASVEKMAQINGDSEMEEGEIVDELDDLSDISSEEEFLLRQRLEVLEDYNNVLERTQRKRSTSTKQMQDLMYDLSEISAAELEEKQNSHNQVSKHSKHSKHRHKVIAYKKIEEAYARKKKEHRKKSISKRKQLKIISETSDESEDEYRNKRKKLADAVIGQRGKTDTTSLSARLKKMLNKAKDVPDEKNLYHKDHYTPVISNSIDEVDCSDLKNKTPNNTVKSKSNLCEPIDIISSDDDDVELVTNEIAKQPTEEPDFTVCNNKQTEDNDSDEDLAQLRQQVLSTKTLKTKPVETEIKARSDDEDSDTTELRLICLKSTLLKRAIEMKQKQKLHKKLSQTTLEDDILFSENLFYPPKVSSGNNTDIESMDMDMGSEDEKLKDDNAKQKKIEADRLNNIINSAIPSVTNKDDELDEDEDLLRAKLLTSLTKNLPNLVSPEILNNIDNKNDIATTVSNTAKTKLAKEPEQKRFIIKLGESDSEGEHEATKNLTKMHIKLSEQSDFQQKLDLFLKTTRKQVENNKLPDVVQKQPTPKKTEKFIAKAVNHLPKSEQLEYKNLVRRMAELEKMKQLRHVSMGLPTQPLRDTMNPRINTDVNTNNNLDEKISMSRKRIADESAKMLKLKEEATKLTQKYKIVASELHNISTAITLNKKQQRAAHISLTKIRHQHQLLIKSSSTLHSKAGGYYNNFTNKVLTTEKLQKENNPKDDYKNAITQKTVKISVFNDLQHEKNRNSQQLIQENVDNNTKIDKKLSPVNDKRIVEISETQFETRNEKHISVQRGDFSKEDLNNHQQIYANDYRSPLDAFGDDSWNSDPNAILCPFEVGGQCKDPDCKYLHTQILRQ